MSSPSWMSLLRQVSLLSAAVAFAACSASAQSAVASSTSGSTASSASDSSSLQLLAEDGVPALPSAPAPAAAGQNDQNGGYQSHSFWSHLTYEGGGGFNAPSSDSSPYITWGGNFTLGAGYRFSNRLSALLEYQFIDSKLPGALIAETGTTGGHDHIWSFTAAPVFDLFPKSSNDVYVTGGGGFYRKVTSFTVLSAEQFCSYFYCGIGYAPQTVGHFSSNQGGWNIGAGYEHRMGGMYGESRMKLFAEFRYLDVLSPEIVGKSANGLPPVSIAADTKIFPVTFGVRW